GNYCATADFETFLKRSSTGSPRNDIARLVGSRFVASIEVDEGKKLAEGLIKAITGGDQITASFLFREAFEFLPEFKLWLVANDATDVKAGDDAMWRRILRVPFEQVVPKAKRDPQIKAQLRNPEIAGPAILAWAVQGCLDWQKKGLQIPASVTNATEEYRQEMNPLSDFIMDCCTVDTNDQTQWEPTSNLRQAYQYWMQTNGSTNHFNDCQFAKLLRQVECTPMDRQFCGKKTRGWQFVSLNDDQKDKDGRFRPTVNFSSPF
ncbi:MAG TPA: hypothetical protein ENH10_06725, partial [Bacteroidetes bacterium]|nr:hypothetical protein [Bacteroidota bacterium]HEX04836.1 hypothetical protein [Bacteroidota bacterium]